MEPGSWDESAPAGTGAPVLWRSVVTILVRAGESVYQEQQIGTVGSTGRATGPHLHFEIIQDGARVDPMKLLP